MGLQIRGVGGGRVRLVHVSLLFSANPSYQLHGVVRGDKDIIAGGASPELSKEISGCVNQRDFQWAVSLAGKRVFMTVAMGSAERVPRAR